MVALVFLDPNVFNVAKYVVMSLTVSFAADLLLDTFCGYTTARKLLNRGWARPIDSSIRMRYRRGIRLRKAGSGITIFVAVVAVSILEMALEFSTGAESVWIRRTEMVRISNKASNVSSLLQSDLNYLLKMRFALERVENTCYGVENMWYHPVMFNMTNSTEFHGLGKAAICPSNFSDPKRAEEEFEESVFLASDVAATGIWNESELRVGRDVDQTEETIPFPEIGDTRIGSTEKYSFLAVNFSDFKKYMVEGSDIPLSGRSDVKKPKAFHTANFTVESGRTLECLMIVKYGWNDSSGEWERENFGPEVCLVPIGGDRMVLGLFDDIENAPKGFQLVMSVALKNVKSFRDLDVLRYLPWMVGVNNGLHTYREIGILTVLAGCMVESISIGGYQNVRIEVGSRSITVPTLTVWGLALLIVATVSLVIAKFVLSVSRKKMKLSGNLGTVRGVAEHWARQNEEVEDFDRDRGRVVFVLEGGDKTMPGVVRVRRQHELPERTDWYINQG